MADVYLKELTCSRCDSLLLLEVSSGGGVKVFLVGSLY